MKLISFKKDENDNDAHIDPQVNIRNYSQLTDQQRIAIRGRAQLGEIVTTRIRIKESKEFKVKQNQVYN